jgi:hypothetical protein
MDAHILDPSEAIGEPRDEWWDEYTGGRRSALGVREFGCGKIDAVRP